MKKIVGVAALILLNSVSVLAATVKVLNVPTAQQSYTLNGNDQHQLKIEPIKTDIILHPDIPSVLVKEIAAKLAQQQIQYQWQYTELNGAQNQESITFSLTPNTQKPLIFTGTHGELDVSSPLTVVKDLDDALLSKPDMAGFMKQYCTEAFLPIGTLHQYLELNDSKQVDVEKHIVLRCARVTPSVTMTVQPSYSFTVGGDAYDYTGDIKVDFSSSSALPAGAFTLTATYGSGIACMDPTMCYLVRKNYDFNPQNSIWIVLKTAGGDFFDNNVPMPMSFDIPQGPSSQTLKLYFELQATSIAPGNYRGTINLSLNMI
ncbi:hypothetical protein ACPV5G_16085 [Photobacterium damselae]|uniref:hypothetical protein n=1 Tax=Photobacterium damselae TaxID=38293 RepID=UPI0040677280